MPHALILASTVTAGYYDVRYRRIPNWLVALTIIACCSWHALRNGPAGFSTSIAGLLVGTAVLFPLFLLRGMGAGDVKLMAAIR